jgi:hypothetical protein
MGFAAGGSQQPPPPPPPAVLPGGSSRRRGSVWEPSVAFAIAAAKEEQRLWREAQKPARPLSHPAAKAGKTAAKPVDRRAEVLFLTLEAVQLAIKRAETKWLREALRRVEAEEQAKLVALAREEQEAAEAVMLLMLGATRHHPVTDEEAAAALMNMLMNVRH